MTYLEGWNGNDFFLIFDQKKNMVVLLTAVACNIIYRFFF